MPADENEEVIELDEENPVEVSLEDETAEVQEEVQEEEISEELSEEELAGYSAGVRKRIDKLTAKYREAERREQAALDYAKSVKSQNESLQQSAQALNTRYGEEYKGRVTTDLETAKKRYRDAYESGDTDELVAATTDLSRLTV